MATVVLRRGTHAGRTPAEALRIEMRRPRTGADAAAHVLLLLIIIAPPSHTLPDVYRTDAHLSCASGDPLRAHQNHPN